MVVSEHLAFFKNGGWIHLEQCSRRPRCKLYKASYDLALEVKEHYLHCIPQVKIHIEKN